MADSSEELAQTDDVRRIWGAKNQHVSQLAGDQHESPTYEDTKQEVAYFCITGYEQTQVTWSYLQNFTRLKNASKNDRSMAANHPRLTREHPRVKLRNWSFSIPI